MVSINQSEWFKLDCVILSDLQWEVKSVWMWERGRQHCRARTPGSQEEPVLGCICDVILFENWVFAEAIMVGLKSSDWCPDKEKQTIEAWREEGHVTRKAETHATHL